MRDSRQGKGKATYFPSPTSSANSRRSVLRWPRKKLLVVDDMVCNVYCIFDWHGYGRIGNAIQM